MKPKDYEDAKRAARNGTRTQIARLLVEGSYFTYAQMAERTGRTEEQCRTRYAHLKRSGKWPVTWEAMA